MIEVIAEHSVDLSLLEWGDMVLDAGARGFAFAHELCKRKHFVFAMEPDPTVEPVRVAGMGFIRKALVGPKETGIATYAMWANGTANCLTHVGSDFPKDAQIVNVPAVDIVQLSRDCGIQQWGIVKLDIEGAEKGVLSNWPGPLAKQISVEFHLHTGALNDEDVRLIVRHLDPWYRVVQHEKSERHYIKPANYWDSLFVLRQ